MFNFHSDATSFRHNHYFKAAYGAGVSGLKNQALRVRILFFFVFKNQLNSC